MQSAQVMKARKTQKDLFNNLKLETLNYDWTLAAVVLVITIAGLAFLASALAVSPDNRFLIEFSGQIVLGIWPGAILAFILARTDYHLWFKMRTLLLIATFVLLSFVVVPVIMARVTGQGVGSVMEFFDTLPVAPRLLNGAIRWIRLGNFFTFQPVELAKLSLAVYFASYLNDLRKKEQEIDWGKLLKPFLILAGVAGLIILQPDLGSVILIFIIIGSILWVGKVPFKILSVLALVGMLFATYFAVADAEYRVDRLRGSLFGTFLQEEGEENIPFCQREENYDTTSCYQINRISEAVGNGGLFGRGYGNSEVKFDRNIPEVSSDAIIAVIGEEIGFVFTVMFLSLYLILLFRGLKISKEAPDTGGKVLAVGISVWLVSQAFLNVTGMTGITPSKGIPLPFVSEGGTAMIVNLSAVGILLNISAQSVLKNSRNGKKTG
jgi:cell division protein FtsW